MALKSITAHLAVGPLWDQLVVRGTAHRISWCQLEYKENCSLITFHGLTSNEDVDKVVRETPQIIEEMVDKFNEETLAQLHSMADRVGWHYVREMECDPYLIIASAICKTERYCAGDQLAAKLQPRSAFEKLAAKPAGYWMDLLKTYFLDTPVIITKVIPKVSEFLTLNLKNY